VSSIILYAVPLFLLLIAVEYLWDRQQGTQYFSAADSYASLALGVWSVTTKVIVVGGGAWLYQDLLQGAKLFTLSTDNLLVGVVAFVAYDFCYYWFHRISHERNIFWAGHVIHHQSEEYNLTTALRQTSTGWFGFIFYFPLYLIGFDPALLATVAGLNLIYQFWVHTRHIGKLGIVDRILVTPSNHRVHHAQNPEYIDKNHGGVFIVWDRLFGTYAEERSDLPIVYGVTRPLHNSSPFAANLQVWWGLLLDAIRTRRWSDKIGIWIARTGWRPADVADDFPVAKTQLSGFKPYRPHVSKLLLGYLWLQLAGSVVFGAWFVIHPKVAGVYQVVTWFIVSIPLVTAAWLIHGRERGRVVEVLRLFMTLLLLGLWLTRGSELFVSGLIIFTLLSAVYFVLVWRGESECTRYPPPDIKKPS